MIRITGGKFRSRKLETPNTDLTVPTMDKVRAGVFNALGNNVENFDVLDLFCGSGSYGFEALSRGAKFVDFVDCTNFAQKSVEQNSKALGVSEFEFHRFDALTYLNSCTKQFDLVTMDPPYFMDIIPQVLKFLVEKNLLKEGAIIIAESENEVAIDPNIFKDVRTYQYGLARVYVIRK